MFCHQSQILVATYKMRDKDAGQRHLRTQTHNGKCQYNHLNAQIVLNSYKSSTQENLSPLIHDITNQMPQKIIYLQNLILHRFLLILHRFEKVTVISTIIWEGYLGTNPRCVGLDPAISPTHHPSSCVLVTRTTSPLRKLHSSGIAAL